MSDTWIFVMCSFLFTNIFKEGILIRKFNLTFICAHICIIPIKIQKGKMYTPILSPCVIWFPLFHINLSDHIAFNPCWLFSCSVPWWCILCVSFILCKNLKMGHIQINEHVCRLGEEHKSHFKLFQQYFCVIQYNLCHRCILDTR